MNAISPEFPAADFRYRITRCRLCGKANGNFLATQVGFVCHDCLCVCVEFVINQVRTPPLSIDTEAETAR